MTVLNPKSFDELNPSFLRASSAAQAITDSKSGLRLIYQVIYSGEPVMALMTAVILAQRFAAPEDSYSYLLAEKRAVDSMSDGAISGLLYSGAFGRFEYNREYQSMAFNLASQLKPTDNVNSAADDLVLLITHSATPGKTLLDLRNSGELWVIPELFFLSGTEAKVVHHPERDSLIHTALVLDQVDAIYHREGWAGSGDLPGLRLAALFHDVGKAIPAMFAAREDDLSIFSRFRSVNLGMDLLEDQRGQEGVEDMISNQRNGSFPRHENQGLIFMPHLEEISRQIAPLNEFDEDDSRDEFGEDDSRAQLRDFVFDFMRLHGKIHASADFGSKGLILLIKQLDKTGRIDDLLLCANADAAGRLGMENREYPQRRHLASLHNGLTDLCASNNIDLHDNDSSGQMTRKYTVNWRYRMDRPTEEELIKPCRIQESQLAQ